LNNKELLSFSERSIKELKQKQGVYEFKADGPGNEKLEGNLSHELKYGHKTNRVGIFKAGEGLYVAAYFVKGGFHKPGKNKALQSTTIEINVNWPKSQPEELVKNEEKHMTEKDKKQQLKKSRSLQYLNDLWKDPLSQNQDEKEEEKGLS